MPASLPGLRIEILPDETIEQNEEDLTSYINDLFLDREYLGWRRELKAFSAGSWHSLVTCLASCNAPTDVFLAFGECVYSKLVFSYIEAPDYAESQLLMVQFTVAGSMWHCVVWHCPERS